jgi:4-diphosphocytidyl-2C-methyl-D-erythritol kinase
LLLGGLNDTGLYCGGTGDAVEVEIFPKILPDLKVEIAMPSFNVSTAEAFALYDKKKIPPNPFAEVFIDKLRQGRLDFSLIYNVFEELLTSEQSREIKSIALNFIRKGAAAAHMSGSGSAVYKLQ